MITRIPDVNFQVRVRDDSIKGDNPFKWKQNRQMTFLKIKR